MTIVMLRQGPKARTFGRFRPRHVKGPHSLTHRKSSLTISHGLRRSIYCAGRPHPPPHPRGVAQAAQDCGGVGGRPAGEPARRVAAPEGARAGEPGARRAARQPPRVLGAARRSGRAAAVPGAVLVRRAERVQRRDRATHEGRTLKENDMLEPLVKTIEVPCNQAKAFTVFMDMGSWWPKDKFATSVMRGQSVKALRVDSRKDGKIVEITTDVHEHMWCTNKPYVRDS